MKNLEIKIYKDFSDELSKLWLTFESESENYFFQSYNWQKLWYKQQIKYKNKINNHTVVVFIGNIIVMILPLNIQYNNNVKILSWSGFPFSDYNAPLIKSNYIIDQKVFAIIWKKIISNNDFDCVFFDNQPEKIINLLNPFFYFLKNNNNNYYYGIKFDKEFDIKKKELANIKYQTNRLKNIGRLDFKTASNTEDINKVLRFITVNKFKQYERTNAWNLFNIDMHRDFFELCNLTLKENIDISYLSLNNEIIAAQSGFKYKKRYYYLFPAYKNEFRKFSPGKILLQKLIIEHKSKLFDCFDLTIGSENYKANFSNYKMKSALFFHSKNLKGFIYILFCKLKYFIKLLIISLPFKKNILNNFLRLKFFFYKIIYNRIKINVK
jgi:CelD/BcsL family acetyltransferase involved in cellulose biosynthesis